MSQKHTLFSPRSLVAAAVLSFALPCAVQAAPNILATHVDPECDSDLAVLTVTLDPVTYNYYGDSLYYHFDSPSPGTQSGWSGNPVTMKIPSSFAPGTSHFVQITTTSASTGGSASASYPFTVSICGPPAKGSGLTWKLVATNPTAGTVDVGCGPECDPYDGDTPCGTALPLLCIKKTGAGFPLAKPASVDVSSIYHQWAGGVVGTTSATVPPSTLAEADDLCFLEFGADWRVAEFHDGWGWYFQAFGGVGNPSSRFWVDIDDQPNATCWDD